VKFDRQGRILVRVIVVLLAIISVVAIGRADADAVRQIEDAADVIRAAGPINGP
jgi:hypothetical protein